MPRASKAAVAAADGDGMPESLSGFEFDEDGADEVTADEVLGVLAELGLGKDGAAKKKAPTPAPASALSRVPAPSRPPAAAAAARPPHAEIGQSVSIRLQEFQRAAVLARQKGSMDEALHWLRRSKEYVQRIEAVLATFPAPGDADDGDDDDGDDDNKDGDGGDDASTLFPSTPSGLIAPSGAAPVDVFEWPVVPSSEDAAEPAEAGENSSGEEEVGEEDDESGEADEQSAGATAASASHAHVHVATEAMAAGATAVVDEPTADEPAPSEFAELEGADPFAHVVSLRVLDFEAKRHLDDSSMIAACERRRSFLQALERRRRVHPDGESTESAAVYAGRLEHAIAEEKVRSRDAKLVGDTKEALNALRRAKIMMEELDAVGPDSPL